MSKTDEKVHKFISAVQGSADEAGFPFTPRGRKYLRREVRAELEKGGEESGLFREGEFLKENSERFIKIAEEQRAFSSKTRVGVVITKGVVRGLREAHRETQVCKVWPFC